MFSSCCDKDYALFFYDRPPAWRQSSLKLEWMLTTANAAGINRSTEERDLINFGHPSYDWPLRTLLSFCNRSLSALTAWPSSSSSISSIVLIRNVTHNITLKNRCNHGVKWKIYVRQSLAVLRGVVNLRITIGPCRIYRSVWLHLSMRWITTSSLPLAASAAVLTYISYGLLNDENNISSCIDVQIRRDVRITVQTSYVSWFYE
jgi:hypothetical protein